MQLTCRLVIFILFLTSSRNSVFAQECNNCESWIYVSNDQGSIGMSHSVLGHKSYNGAVGEVNGAAAISTHRGMIDYYLLVYDGNATTESYRDSVAKRKSSKRHQGADRGDIWIQFQPINSIVFVRKWIIFGFAEGNVGSLAAQKTFPEDEPFAIMFAQFPSSFWDIGGRDTTDRFSIFIPSEMSRDYVPSRDEVPIIINKKTSSGGVCKLVGFDSVYAGKNRNAILNPVYRDGKGISCLPVDETGGTKK